jgi:hypothetical protein
MKYENGKTPQDKENDGEKGGRRYSPQLKYTTNVHGTL